MSQMADATCLAPCGSRRRRSVGMAPALVLSPAFPPQHVCGSGSVAAERRRPREAHGVTDLAPPHACSPIGTTRRCAKLSPSDAAGFGLSETCPMRCSAANQELMRLRAKSSTLCWFSGEAGEAGDSINFIGPGFCTQSDFFGPGACNSGNLACVPPGGLSKTRMCGSFENFHRQKNDSGLSYPQRIFDKVRVLHSDRLGLTRSMQFGVLGTCPGRCDAEIQDLGQFRAIFFTKC